MNTKQKSILAGGLGVLTALVWVPQFLSPQAERLVTELPAEDPGAQDSGQPELGEPVAGGTTEQPGAAQQGAVLGELSALEASLSALTREQGPDLATLLASLSSNTTARVDDSSGEAAPTAKDGLLELGAFAASNPLSGLIHSADGSAALLGHHIVHEGETVLAGRIRVLGIGPGWVELGCEDARLTVGLPAFRARAGVTGRSTSAAHEPTPLTEPEPGGAFSAGPADNPGGGS